MYFPPSLTEAEALLLGAAYTTGEPVILSGPGFSGVWEVGYCDYPQYRAYLSDYEKLWSSVAVKA